MFRALLAAAIRSDKPKKNEAKKPLLDNQAHVIDPVPSEDGTLQRPRTVTFDDSSAEQNVAEQVVKDTEQVARGNTLYTTMYNAVEAKASASEEEFNEAAAVAFKRQAAGPDNAREKLEDLLTYLDHLNRAQGLSYEASVNTSDYLAEVRARLKSKSIFRGLSDEEVVQHAELVFALITQLKRLSPSVVAVYAPPTLMLETEGGATEEKPGSATADQALADGAANKLNDRIVKRGIEVAKQLPMEKWKAAVGFFLIALGFLTALVAIGTVITLAMNPATAPAVFAGAAFASTFGFEASIVAAIYFIGAACLYAKNRLSLLPKGETTAGKVYALMPHLNKLTKKQAAIGAGVGLTLSAPAGIAAVEGFTGMVINPTSVAINSAAGPVATTTGAGAVASLTVIAATFFAGIDMIRRGKNFFGARNLAADHAKKVLDQTPPPPSAGGTVTRSSSSRSIR